MEVAGALALISLNGASFSLVEVAKSSAGIPCTISSVPVSASWTRSSHAWGRQERTLLLDCRSLEFEMIPIPDRVRMVVCNTMVKHQHAGGEVQRRRKGAKRSKILSKWYPNIRALRDVSFDKLAAHSQDLPEKIYKRCRHVVEENNRVQEGAADLRAGDLESFGERMRESHSSLRDLYEVSCHELDIMVEVAKENIPATTEDA